MMDNERTRAKQKPVMSNRWFRFCLGALGCTSFSALALVGLGLWVGNSFALWLAGAEGLLVVILLSILGWLYRSGRVETKKTEMEAAARELSSLLQAAPEAIEILSAHIHEENRKSAWVLWYLALTVGVPMVGLLVVLAVLPTPIRGTLLGILTIPGVSILWSLMAVVGGPVAMLSGSDRLWPKVLGWSLVAWGVSLTLLGILWPLAGSHLTSAQPMTGG